MELVNGKSYLAYANDAKLRLALERCLSVVGEALQQALRQKPDLTLFISDILDIISMRHRLVHAYHSIEDKICWSAATDELPGLLEEVEGLLETGRSESHEQEWHE